MTEDEKFILEGRIYPAIKNCVNYRYLILTGFIGFYGFLFSNEEIRLLLQTYDYKWWTFFFWLMIIFHNLFNYMCNAQEQIKLEEGRKPNLSQLLWASNMEILFSLFMFINCLAISFV